MSPSPQAKAPVRTDLGLGSPSPPSISHFWKVPDCPTPEASRGIISHLRWLDRHLLLIVRALAPSHLPQHPAQTHTQNRHEVRSGSLLQGTGGGAVGGRAGQAGQSRAGLDGLTWCWGLAASAVPAAPPGGPLSSWPPATLWVSDCQATLWCPPPACPWDPWDPIHLMLFPKVVHCLLLLGQSQLHPWRQRGALQSRSA